MLLKYFKCFIKPNDSKPKLKRETTPFPKQTFIDVDKWTIEQKEMKSKFENVDYEYLPNSSVLHIFQKELKN